ncbi:MAG TPA: YjbQ family protein [Candidatus Dormibacteraeota bacterium]|nr:YjbQ family protein [Candidatus Dormibacteraeota bacterium]
MHTLKVKTDRRTQLVEVTAQIQKAISQSGVSKGICYLYVPHTTAGITINECADPVGATRHWLPTSNCGRNRCLRGPLRWLALSARVVCAVLEFLIHAKPRHLYSGSVLPDQVHLL